MITMSYVFSGEISGMEASGAAGWVEWKRTNWFAEEGVDEEVEGQTARGPNRDEAGTAVRREEVSRTRRAACLRECAERIIARSVEGE